MTTKLTTLIPVPNENGTWDVIDADSGEVIGEGFRNRPAAQASIDPSEKWGIIICGSREAARSWVDRLRRIGLNYFVLFMDVRGPAIQYAYAEWAGTDCLAGYHVDDF